SVPARSSLSAGASATRSSSSPAAASWPAASSSTSRARSPCASSTSFRYTSDRVLRTMRTMRSNRRSIFLLVGMFFLAACGNDGSDASNNSCGPQKPCPQGFTCNDRTGVCEASSGATVALTLGVSGMGSLSAADDSKTFGPCATGTCAYDVTTGSTATVTAAPASGWKLGGWAGDCTGSATEVQLTMDKDRSCTATFVVATGSFPVPAAPTAGGSVSSAALTCSAGGCSGDVAGGTDITLTATPSSGYRFAGWSGSAECEGKTANPLTIHVVAEVMCTARFVQTFTVAVTA